MDADAEPEAAPQAASDARPDDGLLVALNCLRKLQLNGIALGASKIRRVQVSSRDPSRRHVYRLDSPDGPIAIKFDRKARDSDYLRREFAEMERLSAAMPADSPNTIVRPIYLDPNGIFIATGWIEGKTAGDRLSQAETAGETHDILRRAGEWLARLHGSAPVRPATYRLRTTRDRLADRVARLKKAPLPIDPALLDTSLARVDRGIARLHRSPVDQVISHGDFHASNLLMTDGQAIGLDFGQVAVAPPGFDIAEFLVDAHAALRPRLARPCANGVADMAVDAFLDGYGRPVDRAALDDVIAITLFRRLTYLLELTPRPRPRQLARIRAMAERMAEAAGGAADPAARA